MDSKPIIERVERAKSAVKGRTASLLGYNANAIQEFVTWSTRPIAMRGASRILMDFDNREAATPGCLFAGGGRGIKLLPADQAEREAERLEERFREATFGGVVATAIVPWELDAEAASLALLRLKLAIAEESAPPPERDPPRSREEQCPSCRRRITSRQIKKGDDIEQVCECCFHLIEAGRRGRIEKRELWTLQDLGSESVVAVVSADGNEMGLLFSSLTTLEELAITSVAVAGVFQAGLGEAAEGIGKIVAPVAGGDDVRAFLPPEELLGFVERLVASVESRAKATSQSLAGVLRRETVDRLANTGLGAGAVVGSDHYPAWRLLQYAHDLERSAKALCRSGAARSALDFAFMTTGDEFTQGLDVAARTERDCRPLPVGDRRWHESVDRAGRLRKLPKSQLHLSQRRPDTSPAEFENAFRYQVARTRAWKQWFSDSGIDWSDPELLTANRPDPGLLALGRLAAYEAPS